MTTICIQTFDSELIPSNSDNTHAYLYVNEQ